MSATDSSVYYCHTIGDGRSSTMLSFGMIDDGAGRLIG
jgi:hypothetical protein